MFQCTQLEYINSDRCFLARDDPLLKSAKRVSGARLSSWLDLSFCISLPSLTSLLFPFPFQGGNPAICHFYMVFEIQGRHGNRTKLLYPEHEVLLSPLMLHSSFCLIQK